MAITDNTVKPIKPFGGAGGTQAADILTAPIDNASTVFQDGDILVVGSDDTGVEPSATQVATGTVLGVCTTKNSFTSAATVGAGTRDGDLNSEVVQFYPAWPGRRFAGNIIAAAATDQTGAWAADIFADMGITYADATTDTVAAGEGVACLEEATPNPAVAFTLEYVTPQYDVANGDWQYGREAGVGILNPRVVFTFLLNELVFQT